MAYPSAIILLGFGGPAARLATLGFGVGTAVPRTMRAPSGRLFNRDATLRVQTWTRDAAGGRTRADGSTSTVRATAQPLSASRTPEHLRQTGITAWQVLFPADPSLNSGDLITLDDGTILAVDAPAMDQAGRKVCWTLVAKQVS